MKALPSEICQVVKLYILLYDGMKPELRFKGQGIGEGDGNGSRRLIRFREE
jgi:hypothetical protein